MTLNVVALQNQRLTSFRLPWLLLVPVLRPGRARGRSAGPGGFKGPSLNYRNSDKRYSVGAPISNVLPLRQGQVLYAR